MIDIVFPQKNEKGFISMAERLGYSALCFIYDKPANLEPLKKTAKLKLFQASLANTKKPQKKNPGLSVARSSHDDRFVFEKIKPDIIFDLESHNKKDYMHHRSSGLNQVMCKIAAKNSIIITFSLSTILSLKPNVWGRVMQNLKFCRKYSIKTAFASFARSPYQMRAPNDIKSLALLLNATTEQAKNSLVEIEKRLENK